MNGESIEVDISINPSRVRKSIRAAVLKTAIEDASIPEVREALADVGYLPYLGAEPEEESEHPPAEMFIGYEIFAYVKAVRADGEGGTYKEIVASAHSPVDSFLAARSVIEAVSEATKPAYAVVTYPGAAKVGRALGDARPGESLDVGMDETWGTDVPSASAMNVKLAEPREPLWRPWRRR